ncbi:hypothetical protein ASG43_17755 [Aureimonas sp. Leaf454]|uniref:hypothetical protein n=1 Tax=Aureimonas sp. Leaf454 TaxID=1736381 RepID=UPI0006F3CB01|nr:hypothetical protein [Aureimonas sp. Leaf454]KQT53682.1 hypothetical protein ASG43_17755 [Aureimonas sp. Leaf454]
MSLGIEIFSDETLDRIETVEQTTFDTDEAVSAAMTFIRAGVANATKGGITLSVAELQAVTLMLEVVKTRSTVAREAASELSLWIHG